MESKPQCELGGFKARLFSVFFFQSLYHATVLVWCVDAIAAFMVDIMMKI